MSEEKKITTDLSKQPSLEQLRASMDKAAKKRTWVVEREQTVPNDADVEYKKKINQLDRIMNPTTVDDLMASITFNPQKITKRLPDQIMDREDAARILYRALKYLCELDRREFSMNANKEKVYRMISQYIAIDPDFEKENPGFDLMKGLFIYGRLGTGKTMLFNALDLIFQKMQFHFHQFERTSTKTVIFEVMKNKNLSIGIEKYLSRQWMFDDLGHEKNMIGIFGDKVNVMEEIMTHRYNLFVESGKKTHVTSNLQIENPDEITVMYGDRVRDRFNQMFNFIYMGGDSLRK